MDVIKGKYNVKNVLVALAMTPNKSQTDADAKAILAYRFVMPQSLDKGAKSQICKDLEISEYRWHNATRTLKEKGIMSQNNRDFEWSATEVLRSSVQMDEDDREDLDEETRASLERGIEQSAKGEVTMDLEWLDEPIPVPDPHEDEKTPIQKFSQS